MDEMFRDQTELWLISCSAMITRPSSGRNKAFLISITQKLVMQYLGSIYSVVRRIPPADKFFFCFVFNELLSFFKKNVFFFLPLGLDVR